MDIKGTSYPATIEGLVIPVDWDEKGNVVAVSIFNNEEEEYFIDGEDKGKDLIAYLRLPVEVSGIVREGYKKKMITVKAYSLKPTITSESMRHSEV